jgi:hypothetical protein
MNAKSETTTRKRKFGNLISVFNTLKAKGVKQKAIKVKNIIFGRLNGSIPKFGSIKILAEEINPAKSPKGLRFVLTC